MEWRWTREALPSPSPTTRRTALGAGAAARAEQDVFIPYGEVTKVKVSGLAHGVPVGGELDYLDEGTLTAALKARRAL